MPGRLPKFTLFTGPTCSLCDTAKAALAQVRKTRPFQLQIVNIQDPGQERWRKRYVYWIPALHLEGKEIVKGRWGESEILRALDQWEKEKLDLGAGPNGWMFWPDANGMSAAEVFWKEEVGSREHVFDRIGGLQAGLGDESEDAEDESSSLLGLSRCFNCGSLDHLVPSCPEPRNRALIELSRAIFQFHRESNTSGSERFHVVEDWKLQRLQWLQDFEPGEIRGEALREALNLREGDRGENVPWLYNMLEWGYPPGWVSEDDPREAIWKRILSGVESDEESDWDDFLIFGEGDEKEILSFGPDSSSQTTISSRRTTPELSITDASDAEPHNRSEEKPVESADPLPKVRRWAKYQSPLFSSDLLPIYSGCPLPPINDEPAYPVVNKIPSKPAATPAISAASISSTSDLDGGALHIEHPWRHPDAFSAFGPVGWMTRYAEILSHRAQVFRKMATYSSEQWSATTNMSTKHGHARSVSESHTCDKTGSPTPAASTTCKGSFPDEPLSDDDMDLSD